MGDTIIFGTRAPGGLFRVAVGGGEPEVLTSPDAEQGEGSHAWPDILPGGRAVLFTVLPASGPVEDAQIALLNLDTGTRRVLIPGGSHPRYVRSGHVVYGVEGTLRAVGFDLERLEVTTDPVPVLDGVITKPGGAADFGVSANGSLVYVPGAPATTQARTLVWVDRQGQEEPLGAPPAPYESPRVSPDGQSVAVEVRNPENSDITIYDLERDTPTRLTFDPGADRYRIWTQDGQRVLFASDRDGPMNVYAKAADGTGQADRVTTSDVPQWPGSWSGDGQTLIVTNPGPWDLQTISLGAEDRTEGLIESEFIEFDPQVSPTAVG